MWSPNCLSPLLLFLILNPSSKFISTSPQISLLSVQRKNLRKIFLKNPSKFPNSYSTAASNNSVCMLQYNPPATVSRLLQCTSKISARASFFIWIISYSFGFQITYHLERWIRESKLYTSTVITRTLRSHLILNMYNSYPNRLFRVWYFNLWVFYQFNRCPQTWNCAYLLICNSVALILIVKPFAA